MSLTDYEQQLLDGWEEVAKRGQLTTWILLALKDGDKHMGQIKAFMEHSTHGVITADDQSMYRALRRYHEAELVSFTTEPGDGGGERKLYTLTATGKHVLQAFLKRHIQDLFYEPEIQQLITRNDS